MKKALIVAVVLVVVATAIGWYSATRYYEVAIRYDQAGLKLDKMREKLREAEMELMNKGGLLRLFTPEEKQARAIVATGPCGRENKLVLDDGRTVIAGRVIHELHFYQYSFAQNKEGLFVSQMQNGGRWVQIMHRPPEPVC